jgi:hypothetical protein
MVMDGREQLDNHEYYIYLSCAKFLITKIAFLCEFFRQQLSFFSIEKVYSKKIRSLPNLYPKEESLSFRTIMLNLKWFHRFLLIFFNVCQTRKKPQRLFP